MIDFNGKFIKENQAVIFPENRGYNYGDGIFETLRVVDKKIIFWKDHYQRLISAMELLQLKIPSYFSKDYLENRILKLIKQNNLQNQPLRVKINIDRKAKGFYTPIAQDIDYMIRIEKLNTSIYSINSKKYTVGIYKDHKVSSDLLSTLKTTNKLVNVLGSIYATKNAYDNCFLLNDKENIIEALNGNLFCVFENQIKTPPLSEGCLNGITRKKIIENIDKNKYDFLETPLQVSDLLQADELWITNVIMGIQPVFQFQQKEYKADLAEKMIEILNNTAKIE